MSKPRGRRGDITVRDLGYEVAIFDDLIGVGYSLTGAEAAAWRLCDGTRSVSQIAEQLAREYPQANVETVLERFRTARLLDGSVPKVKSFGRRVALKLIAGAIAGLSLMAPRSARAGTQS